MTQNELIATAQKIVREASGIASSHTGFADLPVNYACIFAHNDSEYAELCGAAGKLGSVVQETGPGPIFRITPIETVAGTLKLLKIRKPDPTKTGLGYADFTLKDYQNFKTECLKKPEYKLTQREDYEFIGLYVEGSRVGVYFANPPLDKLLGV